MNHSERPTGQITKDLVPTLSDNKKANRLIGESSPYLLQHAHNPVDWYPWSELAFQKALAEDKPIVVSIGYSACHWCHVMERESFESDEVASIMNEHFVCIKVDREERPDIDHIYMEAVQAMTGSGGWPLNVFLTPLKKPFYGGTYFPPKNNFNRTSWTEVLLSVAQAYREQKEAIGLQAENLMMHLQKSNFISLQPLDKQGFNRQTIQGAFEGIMKIADPAWGGFGRAPKFPQTFMLNFLMRYSSISGQKAASQQALLTLDKMIYGGIYDQIGGGFCRYATDGQWLVPHFEKMLYDNALLVISLAEAYQFSARPLYKDTIKDTLNFVERELMHLEGGFFAALDADSEGIEGKYYVWDYNEVVALVGEGVLDFCAYFDISPTGNWEGKNILRISIPMEQYAFENKLDLEELKTIIDKGKQALLNHRNQRIRPRLDDKVLLGWNALMALAYIKAFEATGINHYRKIAERNIAFLQKDFKAVSGLLHHTWKDGKATQPAFLDDYAFLIMALVELGQSTAQYHYFGQADLLVTLVEEHFLEDTSGLFYYTPKNQSDILLRKKEVYDGAIPSGNAIMACNYLKLAGLYDKKNLFEKAEVMVGCLFDMAIKYPTSFGVWISLILELVEGTTEIVVIGKAWEKYLGEVLKLFIPFKIVLAGEQADHQFPLMAHKEAGNEIALYLCKDRVCNQPVMTTEELISLL
ncbi:MAG: thioredoxin domain-containing protein [Flavisolibacter sp.]